MKIVLDHWVPKPLKQELLQHQVNTVREMGWEALKNGALLNEAQASGFEVFVTVDQNIQYQQNLRNRSIAVCILIADGTTIEKLTPLLPKLDKLLPTVRSGIVYELRM